MKTRLIRIGNSRGVRLPKPFIAQACLSDEVELSIQQGAIVIAAAAEPRAGWAEAAQELHQRDQDQLEPPVPTQFDETEWEW
mgnify:CR=1 FL=1